MERNIFTESYPESGWFHLIIKNPIKYQVFHVQSEIFNDETNSEQHEIWIILNISLIKIEIRGSSPSTFVNSRCAWNRTDVYSTYPVLMSRTELTTGLILTFKLCTIWI